uniref:Acyl-coenzyme A oxidase N-terminal domain-containing protein n=1 Tax=Anopheles christyi TaxID=43041 RepID=A0A182JXZ0_9DIPT
MPASTVNKDLQAERDKGSFDRNELTLWWVGGKEKLKEKQDLETFLANDPDFHNETPIHFLSHKELYEETIRQATAIFRKVRKFHEDRGNGDPSNYMQILGGLLGNGIIRQGNPLGIHFAMFVPALLGHGSPEQQAEWLPRALKCQMLGTYAQTELGHGTFLRGLETTATYDERTQEFVLESPTLSSYKWWPGGLAHTVNYCVVMAQLFSKGKCHGIQPFIVQLRDEDTHMPMKGIIIGEIGNKLGMNGVNNGYLGFEKVRIPRKNMLMKNAKL